MLARFAGGRGLMLRDARHRGRVSQIAGCHHCTTSLTIPQPPRGEYCPPRYWGNGKCDGSIFQCNRGKFPKTIFGVPAPAFEKRVPGRSPHPSGGDALPGNGKRPRRASRFELKGKAQMYLSSTYVASLSILRALISHCRDSFANASNCPTARPLAAAMPATL